MQHDATKGARGPRQPPFPSAPFPTDALKAAAVLCFCPIREFSTPFPFIPQPFSAPPLPKNTHTHTHTHTHVNHISDVHLPNTAEMLQVPHSLGYGRPLSPSSTTASATGHDRQASAPFPLAHLHPVPFSCAPCGN